MAKAEPNVVPLCDVLLVLLIIFMVITPSSREASTSSSPKPLPTRPAASPSA